MISMGVPVHETSHLFSCRKSKAFAVIILKTNRKTPEPRTGGEVVHDFQSSMLKKVWDLNGW